MQDDEKTRIIHRPTSSEGGGHDAEVTRILRRPQEGGFSSGGSNDPDATRILDRSQGGGRGSGDEATRRLSESDDSDKTVILGPTRRRPSAETHAEVSASEAKNQMHDPVVGWLAVVNGPGAGDFVRLGYGMNAIGRNADQRCRLNFGDEKISRQKHAVITYDSRGRKFWLQHGEGQNLTYIGEMPVLQPMELRGGETISLGNTVLRFVPLCGSDFDYADVQAEK
jgi:hypothetical protein